MVKFIRYMLFTLLLTGCIKEEVKRADYVLQYVNYKDKVSFPFNLDEYNFQCKHDSIDIKFAQKSKMVLLSNGMDEYLDNIYFNFTSDYKGLTDKSFKRDILDISNKKIIDDIYCAGKIALNKHVDSYVFLILDKSRNSEYWNWSKVLVVNLKKNQICSIVEMSDFSIYENSNENLSRTYKWEKDYLLHLNYIQLTKKFLNMQSKLPDYNRYPHFPEEKENKIARYFVNLKLRTFQTKTLRYTVFYIDDGGFVKFRTIDKDKNTIKFIKKNADWQFD